ncbi:hypothetical protein C0J52_05930 [Blattella germanica]|nr:hypothetical protein C0J52_05930 [Blattella germanica]
MKYTVQQRVFIYATFIKTDSNKETRKCFKREFGAVPPPSNRAIQQIVAKFRETGSFEDDISLKQHRMLTEEKLDELCSKMGDLRKKTLADLALETGWSANTLRNAVKLLWTHYKGDSSSTNDCSVDDSEFVLPDDPLADDNNCEDDFENSNFNFKTEVKEEIIIDDDIDVDKVKKEIIIDDDIDVDKVKKEIMIEDDKVQEIFTIDDDDDDDDDEQIKEEIFTVDDEDDDTFHGSLQDSRSVYFGSYDSSPLT